MDTRFKLVDKKQISCVQDFLVHYSKYDSPTIPTDAFPSINVSSAVSSAVAKGKNTNQQNYKNKLCSICYNNPNPDFKIYSSHTTKNHKQFFHRKIVNCSAVLTNIF